MKKLISVIVGLLSVSSTSFADSYTNLASAAVDCTGNPPKEASNICKDEEALVEEYWQNFQSASEPEKEAMFKNAIRLINQSRRMGVDLRAMSFCAVCETSKTK